MQKLRLVRYYGKQINMFSGEIKVEENILEVSKKWM
jgi:hypothetical protein